MKTKSPVNRMEIENKAVNDTSTPGTQHLSDAHIIAVAVTPFSLSPPLPLQ